MRSTTIAILVSSLPVPAKSLVTSPTDNCTSLKIQSIFLIVGIIFLLFITLYSISRYRKQIQALTTLLKQCTTTSEAPLSKKKEAMNESNRQKAEESRNLYETLNGFVVKQQLYLNPDLSRDDLASLIHLNKNHFAQMLQQNSGFKLADYLNNLRIEHAILLLQENPDHTIQAIATDSGFNNMSTFYSLFKKKRKMTPSQYRSVLLEANRLPSDHQDYII